MYFYGSLIRELMTAISKLLIKKMKFNKMKSRIRSRYIDSFLSMKFPQKRDLRIPEQKLCHLDCIILQLSDLLPLCLNHYENRLIHVHVCCFGIGTFWIMRRL